MSASEFPDAERGEGRRGQRHHRPRSRLGGGQDDRVGRDAVGGQEEGLLGTAVDRTRLQEDPPLVIEGDRLRIEVVPEQRCGCGQIGEACAY